MTNSLITIVNRDDVKAALAEVDDKLGADIANLIRAYIFSLEAQIKCLREQSLSKLERLGFYGVRDALTIGEDVAP